MSINQIIGLIGFILSLIFEIGIVIKTSLDVRRNHPNNKIHGGKKK